jgi:hypothetical protein
MSPIVRGKCRRWHLLSRADRLNALADQRMIAGNNRRCSSSLRHAQRRDLNSSGDESVSQGSSRCVGCSNGFSANALPLLRSLQHLARASSRWEMSRQ